MAPRRDLAFLLERNVVLLIVDGFHVGCLIELLSPGFQDVKILCYYVTM